MDEVTTANPQKPQEFQQGHCALNSLRPSEWRSLQDDLPLLCEVAYSIIQRLVEIKFT
jgi:hypothetical protein